MAMARLDLRPVRKEEFVSTYLGHQPLLITIFLGFGLLTALSNYFSIRRFDAYPPTKIFPRVSILVPARNEADNIEACISSLLKQDYPDFEILVLDDHSSDKTHFILSHLAKNSELLHVLEGSPIPAGWLGKHWACHQLAQAATGELLLFTDADTRHAPNTLRDSVSALLAENADLISAFPYEEALTWGEMLIVPFMGVGILSFIPTILAWRFNWASFSVTIGQFMLFRRSAYEAIGGYESVRDHVVDDVMLGRRLVQQGFAWRLMDGTRHISCRMYNGFWQAVDGFTKNVFAFFDYRLIFFVLTWSWMAVVFFVSPYVIIVHAIDYPLIYPYPFAVAATCESVVLWGLAYKRFRFPLYLTLLYPLSFAIFFLVAFRSMIYTLLGQVSWKERNLSRPAWRW